jgi:hypothetical protein
VRLTFEVDGVSGLLRFSMGARDKTVLFHRGRKGTDWPNRWLVRKVLEAGGTPVEVRWIGTHPFGWLTRPDGEPSTLPHVVARPAAVIEWVYENIALGQPIGTVGCSVGSIATYYARYFHPIDDVLRYQLVGGGPPIHTVNAGCGSLVKDPPGRCGHDPLIGCTTDGDCWEELSSCSGFLWNRGGGMARLIDHVHATSDCTAGRFHPSFADSDHRGGDVHNEHPIDFMMNTNFPRAGDDDMGVAAHAALIYAELTGPKSWSHWHGRHCAWLGSELAWEKLRAGMGWPAPSPAPTAAE